MNLKTISPQPIPGSTAKGRIGLPVWPAGAWGHRSSVATQPAPPEGPPSGAVEQTRPGDAYVNRIQALICLLAVGGLWLLGSP